MSVGRQPGKPGWLATVVNITGGTARRLMPADCDTGMLSFEKHISMDSFGIKLLVIFKYLQHIKTNDNNFGTKMAT